MIIHVIEPKEISNVAIDLLIQNEHKVLLKDLSSTEKQKVEGVFIRTYTKVDKNFLTQYPQLKFILRAGVGLDNIDLDLCKEKEINVINSPGSNANAVSEYIVSVVIYLLRNIDEQRISLKNGKWRQKSFMGDELKNKSVGIVGCGAIGKLLAKKLLSFEVSSILGYDPFLDKEQLAEHSITKTDLDTIFKSCDIISLHVPLTAETKNLISMKQLKKMKKRSILINTSRGEIVHEADLIMALKRGEIKGAAIDVFENEPNVNPELLTIKNLILTPHIAGYTKDADIQMSVVCVERFLALVH